MDTPTQIDMSAMRAAATRAVAALKPLANEDRLLLLCQLTQGEQCVGDLEEKLGIRQPTLSQQLGILRDQGLVATRRQGKNIYYRVIDPDALAILQVLYSLYCPKE
jgi:DNA-binding transcriptional ArsR family regulator